MDIKKMFYKLRLSFMMYGFVWALRITRIISRDFHKQLAQNDYSFIMSSKENDTARFFQFVGGEIRSNRHRIPADFALIWRDNQSGGNVMTDIVLGKRKALYHAVINGTLTLEGEGKYVSLFMEAMNQLSRIYGLKKKTKSAGKSS